MQHSWLENTSLHNLIAMFVSFLSNLDTEPLELLHQSSPSEIDPSWPHTWKKDDSQSTCMEGGFVGAEA
ncbi:hypothetical protein PBY51_007432 [Eleginops maclovinus]|uniref:Uncharacterized protein n=1 Tax=Eleginops maclovinus TaxID=56733 RepID=A0AAN7XA18_ELEMC|nr:hypothetical protein PBY51_007432 [Eleginops maclovinus]